MDPAKCQQVRDWPVPRDLHEVRSFVGLCSYYRRHIQGFMELAAPLYELATKGQTVVPRHRCERRRNGSGAVPSPGRRGTGHCLCQQVAGGKRTEVLHGSQGAVGGGSGPQAL